MPKSPTPGQICYAAWCTRQPTAWLYERPLPWAQLDASTRAAWEAAAEAVRAHRTMDNDRCPVCGARDLASRPPGLTEGREVHRAMTCEDCAATWVTVYTYAETRVVSDTPHA